MRFHSPTFARLTAALALCALPAAAAFAASSELPPSHGRIRFDQGHSARVPFVVSSQHVWVRGTIGTADSVWVVVDTGAGATVIDDSLARVRGFKFGRSHEATGAAGRQQSWSVSTPPLRLPGFSLERKQTDATALGAFGAAGGHPMHVILGYELFRDCVVRFDYANAVMEVWDAKHAPADLGGTAVPMTLAQNHPHVEGEITVPGRAPLRGKFVIDTGSSLALLVHPGVVARESLDLAFPRTLALSGRGVGGELRMRSGRAESFALGDLRFEKPITVLAAPTGGQFSTSTALGNIGGGLLGRCRVTFDYSRQVVRFEPAANFGDPFEADMSGFAIQRRGEAVVVHVVNPDSPAADAGIREGDRVTAIDGVPAADLDLPSLRKKFQRPGSVVKVDVARDGETFTATLTLRRLI